VPDKHFFFVDTKNIYDNSFKLDSSESHHLSHVLRIKEGESVWLLDGKGTCYEGQVDQINSSVLGKVTAVHSRYGEADMALHLAFGILKKDGLEWMLEKGTEVGVKSFQPLVLDRCVKKTINLERCAKIVASAAKQCGRSYFPKVCEPISLDDWLDIYHPDYRCALHPFGGSRDISSFAIDYQKGPVHLLVGPEGDFTHDELGMIADAEVELISMGKRRLRAETAAVTGASFMINFDLGSLRVN
jgi:16S rRNA (uracil1498-N3)-methyltransferase